MRDARPLPGKTPAEVLSQLAHRTFGLLRIERVRAVLDFHGLADREAEAQIAVAGRHGITGSTLRDWRVRLAAAGSRQPLSVELITEIGRRSREDEDHLSRARIASTFGLRPPATPRRPSPPPAVTASTKEQASARTGARIACRVLVVVGPLTLPVLHESVLRSRRYRDGRHLRSEDLAAALTAVGASVDEHERWHAPPGWQASDRDRLVVSMATGRDLTRGDLSKVLITVGYSPVSASGRTIDTHPMIRKVAGDRYRIVSEHLVAGSSAVDNTPY